MAQAAIDTDGESVTTAELAPWTRRIVAGTASVSDVPERKQARIAREVKAYADRYPDVGRSATVRRLVDDLTDVEVSLDE